MRETSRYLEKHQLFAFQIEVEPASGLGVVVVIPCFSEPDLLTTLDSLAACDRPGCEVEVLVVVNGSEQSSQETHDLNRATLARFEQWVAGVDTPGVRFFAVDHPRLPARHAGVGLARKIGMDEAVNRLARSASGEGVVACLDADCRVEPNYLVEIEQYFRIHPGIQAASIHYEHPLEGHDNSAAIALYELHLRYYVWALRYAGLPYAHQTVGSSMAVRSEAYCRQGGMNRRKAGEDFYFLQKFSESLGSITQTCVVPSPRESSRVPFGTGKAMADARCRDQLTYDPRIFDQLRQLLDLTDQLARATPGDSSLTAGLTDWLKGFLEQQAFPEALAEIQDNTTDLASFRKRFLRWFNAFRALKCVHFAVDNGYPRVPVPNAAAAMLVRLEIELTPEQDSARGLLAIYRQLDRDGVAGAR